MLKIVRFSFVLAVFALLFASCGKNQKQSAGDVSGTIGDATEFAKTQLGESVQIVFKGDITGNKRDDALALVVTKDFGGNRYWIKKGSVIEKTATGWNTLIEMGEVLKTPKGQMIEQMKAVNGYIVSFKTDQKPMNIYISIASEDGRPSSDEAKLQWNPKDSIYEFKAASDDSTP